MTTRPTQHDAAATYEALQAKAAGESQQLTAERVGLAELRTEREVPRELAAAAPEPIRSAGAVGWVAIVVAVLMGVFACAALNVAYRWLATHDLAQGVLAVGLAAVALLALAGLAGRR